MRRFALTLATVTALLAGSTVALGGVRAGTYRGRTSGGSALRFRASARQVNGFTYRSRFHCTNHSTFVSPGGPYMRVPVTGGRFDMRRSNRSRSLTDHVKGVFTGSRAHGTIYRVARFTARGKLSGHGPVVCVSRTTWSAGRA